MSAKKMRLIALIALILGISMIAYPYISDYFYKQKQAEVMTRQTDRVKNIEKNDSGAIDKQRKQALEYNEALSTGMCTITDPFDPNRKAHSPKKYNECLNLLGDGVMGSIDIPSIDTKLAIYHSVDMDVLQKGVGHIENSSLPIGGESTHCVLTGHTGIPSKKIFDDLNQVKTGDYFVLNILGEDHGYKVKEIEKVLPDNTDSLRIRRGEDWCTLITCTPYGINTHRLLVHGQRCEIPASYYKKKKTSEDVIKPEVDKLLIYSLTGVSCGMGLVLSYRYFTKRYQKEKEEALHFNS